MRGRPLFERLTARERRPGGPRSTREGYPNLFLASGTATKMLTEIASLEPSV